MLLQGQNLKLGALQEKDIDILSGWYENTDFLRFYDFHPAIPKTREQLMKIYENGTTDTFIPFAVRLKDTGEMIGLIEIDGISQSNRFAWISIGFGDNNHRGKGFGFEALSLAVEFAFNELNLERLQLNVIEYNKAAIKLYEKTGFVREGVYREAVQRNGEKHNLILYGLLRKEWNSND